jgi:hypothetical protein
VLATSRQDDDEDRGHGEDELVDEQVLEERRLGEPLSHETDEDERQRGDREDLARPPARCGQRRPCEPALREPRDRHERGDPDGQEDQAAADRRCGLQHELQSAAGTPGADARLGGARRGAGAITPCSGEDALA